MIQEFFAPTGSRIVGTLQTVQAIALIEGIDLSLRDPMYTGDAKILWETMETVMLRQQPIYVDERGARWRLSDLLRADGSLVVPKRASPDARRPADADLEPSAAASEAV